MAMVLEMYSEINGKATMAGLSDTASGQYLRKVELKADQLHKKLFVRSRNISGPR